MTKEEKLQAIYDRIKEEVDKALGDEIGSYTIDIDSREDFGVYAQVYIFKDWYRLSEFKEKKRLFSPHRLKRE